MTKKKCSCTDFKSQLEHNIELLISKSLTQPFERKNFSISELACLFTVTPNTLRRWCQEEVGVSTKDFVAKYRIAKAKQMLLDGKRPSIIALELGFSEHKTFTTVFKRLTNHSPMAYRQANTKA
ncbi:MULTISPECIES: helix-turn-helix domain-containing protein [unclassified Pseudoalteromonas]|uniref:helix-turn-helix domain-containing protein n=1 Tax=unclassified Pseudoalteromonas TaxID=194690 RepID=UPI0030143057